MKINWFPGHMAKTKRQIAEDLKLIALNFIIFGYLIHRDLLFDDKYYSYRLENTGNEKEIYLDNMKRLLKKVGK